MIYSKKHKLIFVHIYKTGGTSIASALTEYVQRDRSLYLRLIHWVAPKRKPNISPLFKHCSASDMVDYMGLNEFQNSFSFAVVRNPFDLLVSMYFYLKRWERGPEWAKIIEMSFDEWLYYQCNKNPRNQIDFLSLNNKVIVNEVYRFENLSELERELQCRGIYINLPKLNVSQRGHYHEYYKSKELINLVKITYQRDFDYFGYEY